MDPLSSHSGPENVIPLSQETRGMGCRASRGETGAETGLQARLPNPILCFIHGEVLIPF